MTDARIATLPIRTRSQLEKLVKELEAKLGKDLVALVVYGSLARGGFDADRSDVDLVVVVADDSRKTLVAMAPSLELARAAARIEAMVVRADEIARAADVFPLLYDDIRSHNIVLLGEDPFANLEIHDEHRRLRIEQELREARIRLRRAVTDAVGAPRGFAGALERKLKQVRGPLHALLRLRGIDIPDDLASVLAAAGKRWSIDLVSLGRVREAADAAHDTLTKLLDAAIADADASTEDSQ
jgi:predicted nucleotidyltransferase